MSGAPDTLVDFHTGQRAKAVLAQFEAVLILERLEASLRQLYHRLGWCASSIHRHRSKEPPLEMDAAAVDAFRRRNRPDLELYAFAADQLSAALVALAEVDSSALARARLDPRTADRPDLAARLHWLAAEGAAARGDAFVARAEFQACARALLKHGGVDACVEIKQCVGCTTILH